MIGAYSECPQFNALLLRHFAYETRGFQLLLALVLQGHAANGSFCVIACLNIQYFLYFGGIEQVLGWWELRGYKRSRRHGEVRTLLVSHAGPLPGLRRSI